MGIGYGINPPGYGLDPYGDPQASTLQILALYQLAAPSTLAVSILALIQQQQIYELETTDTLQFDMLVTTGILVVSEIENTLVLKPTWIDCLS